MNKISNSILNLMQSDAYINSNNPNHKNVINKIQDYFTYRYNDSEIDATGHNITIRKAWKWCAELDEKTCSNCRNFAGTIYESEDDIPRHPHHDNCRCWIEIVKLDDKNNLVINRIQDSSLEKTLNEESGFVNNPKLIDQPTNYGITQPTLDKYNAEHPNFNFPKKVADIKRNQAKQIYMEYYYDKRNIGEIIIPRISHAVFDMGVMSNYNNVGKIVQKTLNDSMGENLVIDGKIGHNTVKALNNISDNKIDDFMQSLKEHRIEFLRGLPGWNKYGKGWINRTNRY